MEPRLSSFNLLFFKRLLLADISHKRSSPQRLGSYGTTTALQTFPFAGAMNGVAACACVYPTAVGTERSGSALLVFPITLSASSVMYLYLCRHHTAAVSCSF